MDKEYTCKYCGLKRSSKQAKQSHENACPEMRYFADFALQNSYIYTTTLTQSEQADIGGVTTKDERIIKIVKRKNAT